MMADPYSVADLATVFAKVERELAAADGASAIDVLVRSGVDMVPGAQMAGVTLGRGGRFTTEGATDPAVSTADEVQYDLQSGPCVDAIVEDTTFNVADLRSDGRWPVFGHEAYERTGIVSMLSFRLFFETDEDLVAGVNFYSREPGAFDGTSEAVGLLLATHGALAVAQTMARHKADNLLVALKNSREIGVAMGVLIERYKITRDEAFSLLRIASQHRHRKLADIASDVAETGEFVVPPV
jgi:hypothetical protein